MTRREDWPLRLNAAVDAARDKPFDWRRHNCATFAADCVEAMTGASLHRQFAGLHASKASALRASRDLAGEVALVLLDHPRVVPAFAQRGDVVVLHNAGREVLGICLGASAAAVGEKGLEFVPMREVACAWRV